MVNCLSNSRGSKGGLSDKERKMKINIEQGCIMLIKKQVQELNSVEQGNLGYPCLICDEDKY